MRRSRPDGRPLQGLPVARDVRLVFGTPILAAVRRGAARVNPGLARAILARERADAGIVVSNVGGWHSRPDLLDWPEPEIRVFRRWIREAMATLLDLRASRGRLHGAGVRLSAEAWAVVHRDGSCSRSHVHPMNHWSGVYYVSVGEAGSGSAGGPAAGGRLVLTDPRPAAAVLPVPGYPFGDDYEVAPRPGLMVVFPSWLSHWVTPYRGRGERISIAWNLTLEPLRRSPHTG